MFQGQENMYTVALNSVVREVPVLELDLLKFILNQLRRIQVELVFSTARPKRLLMYIN